MYTRGEGERPQGALLVSRGGLILPVLDERKTWHADDIRVLKRKVVFFTASIHSVLGSKRDVRITTDALSIQPKSQVEYILMVKPDPHFPEEPGRNIPGLVIRKAGKQDAQSLYPLQYGYEHEEVLVHPGRFNAENCMAMLKRNLVKQIIYIAELNGTPIAKAGTNGIGFTYCQLGGIYTVPEFRKRGISTSLVKSLVKDIEHSGKRSCLFVKKSNTIARQVYRNLGFRDCIDFDVAYFF